MKSVRIRSYSGPYFPAFRLTTERCFVSLHIQSECGKMRTRITPSTDTFHAVHIVEELYDYPGLLYRVKSVRTWSFSSLYFPAFELNTKVYSTNLHIQSEYEKIWTRENFETVPFRKISTPGNQVKLRYFSQWLFYVKYLGNKTASYNNQLFLYYLSLHSDGCGSRHVLPHE